MAHPNPESFSLRISPESEPVPVPFSQADWEQTPKPTQDFILSLMQQLDQLQKRVDKIETRLNQNSSNSSRPPSSDSPYKPKSNDSGQEKRKPGGQNGHKGHCQVLVEPTKIESIKPERCSCGNTDFHQTSPYHVHQQIELPEIQMDVIHYELHKAICKACGKLNKATLPERYRSGFGIRLSALIAELVGNQGNSRSTVRDFCRSVLGFSISKGSIQKVIDRVSEAIRPHYEAIGRAARQAEINCIDETSWFTNGTLMWLWTMVNTTVAFFMIHSNRSSKAFQELIGDWNGILTSDGYAVYRKWVTLRQTCLAHLIRDARGLSEREQPDIAGFGCWALKELRLLCHMAHAPPTKGEWNAFYARFCRLISRNQDRKDEAGRFARRLLREIDCLWVFLVVNGVEPTNNRAERTLRYGVLWRKRSQGTASDKGNRWVERILSLKQTCRLQERPTFPILVEAVDCYFKGSSPDLSWIAHRNMSH